MNKLFKSRIGGSVLAVTLLSSSLLVPERLYSQVPMTQVIALCCLYIISPACTASCLVNNSIII